MEQIRYGGKSRVWRKALAVIVAICFVGAQSLYANPVGPTVVNGSASFSTQGNLLSVTNSPGAILNWQSFSVAQGEITRFVQQSSASAVLNRVVGLDPSSILGTLQSNGRVFLINRNGIAFGPGAQINVAGLVASTLNLSDADFLANRLNFTDTPGAKGINNASNITTSSGGQVYLVAPDINNSGVISSPQGEVILAAGKSVELVNPGTPDLRVEITAPDNQALNLGQIMADAGKIGIYAGLIRNSGTISANAAVVGENGSIVLKALKDVTLDSSSVISADGVQGGSVEIQSGSLALVQGSVEAKGAQGNGGSISIAGDLLLDIGDINANGTSGGGILLQGNNILQSGAIAADGSAGPGGAVTLRATGGVIQTLSALLSASSASGDGGKVMVQGGDSDRLFTSANLNATGQHGGEIDVLGSDLVLADASLDARGSLGGGTILVGGDSHGANPGIKNASNLLVNSSTNVNADAVSQGIGGKIVLWSDNNTQFYGNASAHGGSQSGDGGFIEVSGKQSLTFGGSTDVGASNGQPGTLLLDPKVLTVVAASAGISAIQLSDPHPGANEQFAQNILALPNSNVVATDPNDSFGASNAGAVYLFDGTNGGLISLLSGSGLDDHVGNGGVTLLPGGNYLVSSPSWSNNGVAGKGAVTFGDGTTGVTGTVSSANSLVGSTFGDTVGAGGRVGITVLTNGNYVVNSPLWTNNLAAGAGAVTFGSGATGVSGEVSPINSLVGVIAGDNVGSNTIALPNGNYVVSSPNWTNSDVPQVAQVGAVTLGNGTTGIIGEVSPTNSLVGTTDFGQVGGGGITVLANSNYVVSSPSWNGLAGAVTFGNGATGIIGEVSRANSLVGPTSLTITTFGDRVGSGGVTALSNGNYVVSSPDWSNSATLATRVGAVTFGNGTTGISGPVTAANSLVGSTDFDQVGFFHVIPLTNGNYVVNSPVWNNGGATPGAGAVTFGNGTTGISGTVSSLNSLVGTTPGDSIGGSGVTVLANGNYLVKSANWSNGGMMNAGAVTFGNGTTGISGAVSAANSLVGTSENDIVGTGGVTVLANSNYVVTSPFWNNGTVVDAGAATFGDNKKGVSGAVSANNSLVGTTMNDAVGSGGVTALTDGSYVVDSPNWNNGSATNAGAVTFGDRKNGISGAVSVRNSLVGTTMNDAVGSGRVTALASGNYVVSSPDWDNGATADAGAVTFEIANARNGVTGAVTAANSLVGTTAFDQVGNGGITALPNGNYVVQSPNWNNISGTNAATNAGAVTFGNGKRGISGAVSAANSLVGSTTDDFVGTGIIVLSNSNYAVISPTWNNGTITSAGAVTIASGRKGISGTVSAANSLVGTSTDDFLGLAVVTQLSNGNVVVDDPSFDNFNPPIQDSGAIFVLPGP